MIEKRDKFYFGVPNFKVSVLNRDEKGIHILVGPKFAPVLSSSGGSFVRSFPAVIPYSTSKMLFEKFPLETNRTYLSGSHDPQTQFVAFYSPETTGAHIERFLFKYLSDRGRGAEISKYCPARVGSDKKIVNGEGEFIIQNKTKTLFWMKIPFRGRYAGINSPGIGGPFTDKDLNENWMRLESGPSVPNNLPFRYDKDGALQYTLFIPVFSVFPKISNSSGVKIDIEYFDLGEIQYFSDLLIQEKKERAFLYNKIVDF